MYRKFDHVVQRASPEHVAPSRIVPNLPIPTLKSGGMPCYMLGQCTPPAKPDPWSLFCEQASPDVRPF